MSSHNICFCGEIRKEVFSRYALLLGAKVYFHLSKKINVTFSCISVKLC